MTPAQQPKHCGHEVVCHEYILEKRNWHPTNQKYGEPCNHNLTADDYKCQHDTRTRSQKPQAPAKKKPAPQKKSLVGKVAMVAKDFLPNPERNKGKPFDDDGFGAGRNLVDDGRFNNKFGAGRRFG